VIRFIVLYPETEGAAFDHDYYREQNVPLAMQAAMAGEGTAEVLGDVANYTSITPIPQTSEIINVG
jgi:hypothetical protein